MKFGRSNLYIAIIGCLILSGCGIGDFDEDDILVLDYSQLNKSGDTIPLSDNNNLDIKQRLTNYYIRIGVEKGVASYLGNYHLFRTVSERNNQNDVDRYNRNMFACLISGGKTNLAIKHQSAIRSYIDENEKLFKKALEIAKLNKGHLLHVKRENPLYEKIITSLGAKAKASYVVERSQELEKTLGRNECNNSNVERIDYTKSITFVTIR